MKELFLTAAEISLSTSVVILGLLLFSKLLNKRYLAKWTYFIWIVLALRLAVPVKFELPRREIVLEVPARMAAPIAAAPVNPGNAIPVATQLVQQAPGVSVLDVLAVVWLVGCVLFLLVHLSSYFAYRRRVLLGGEPLRDRDALRLVRGLSKDLGISYHIPVRTYAGASSPMVLGFFRPILVLPAMDYREGELPFVLRHELIHLKRHDIFVKLLFIVANAIHWFNPVVYIMRKQAVVDMELSCDETVVQGHGYDTRKAYTETLLSTLCRQQTKATGLSTQFYGGKEVMKLRFTNLLSRGKKKNGLIVFLVVIAIVAVLGAVVGISMGDTQEPAAMEENTDDVPSVTSEYQDLKAALSVAYDFSNACLRGDTAAMKPLLDDSYKEPIKTYQSTDYHVSDPLESFMDHDVYQLINSDPDNMYMGPVSIGCQVTLGMNLNSDGEQLTLTLVKREEGWKVREYGLAEPARETETNTAQEPYDKEIMAMYVTLDQFARAYLGGDLETMESLVADSYVEVEQYQGPAVDVAHSGFQLSFAPTPYDLSIDPNAELSIYSRNIPQGSRITMAAEIPGASAGVDRLVVTLAKTAEGWKVADYSFARRGITATEEDCRQIAEITEKFTAAYFAGEDKALEPYLLLPRDKFSSGAYTGRLLEIHAYKGFPRAGDTLREDGRVPVSVEFWEAESPDSYTYLSIEFLKQGTEWKINSYGLEK